MPVSVNLQGRSIIFAVIHLTTKRETSQYHSEAHAEASNSFKRPEERKRSDPSLGQLFQRRKKCGKSNGETEPP